MRSPGAVCRRGWVDMTIAGQDPASGGTGGDSPGLSGQTTTGSIVDGSVQTSYSLTGDIGG